MERQLFFITGSDQKFSEAKGILSFLEKLEIDLPEIQEIDPRKIIEAKLLEASKHQDGELVVEDTSLYITSMNGLPGPLIKWFLKTAGNEGIYKMASAFNNFEAEAKTIVGYKDTTGAVHFFEGVVKGKIVSPRGESGFGWDPIFEPNGSNKTFAEIGIEEKVKFSMRTIAFKKLKEFLDQN